MSAPFVRVVCLLCYISHQLWSSLAEQKVLRDDHAAELFRLRPGQEAPDHEIVYPWIAHPLSGDYVSHDLNLGRSRRSVQYEDVLDGSDLGMMSVKFEGLGEHFHLKVTPNKRLLPATFRSVSHRHDGSNVTTMLNSDFECHHHGIAVSHENSRVAISNCDGLSGSVYDPKGGSFMIHAVPDRMHHQDLERYQHESNKAARPHLIYRRAVNTQHGPSCKVNAQHQLANLPVDVEGSDIRMVEQAVRRLVDEDILIGDPHAGKDRKKRQASKPYFVEIMLVADNELMSRRKFKTDEDATNYLLALANLASLHFNEELLGLDLSFVVTKVMLLNRTDTRLRLGHHSEKSLSSFCMWQLRYQYTPYDNSPDHYDLAILITGWQLCSYSDKRGCDELGRAYVAGACFKYRMCSVVYDNGLTAGFVLAHETGHSLGLRHDGQNGCDNSGTLMSPTIAGRSNIYYWSQCSKRSLLRFVSSSSAYCLANEPPASKTDSTDLAGRRYSMDQQCRLWMGPLSRFCPYSYARSDICQKLWCRHTNANCRTANVPAAAGTPCGGYRSGKVCYRGQCIRDTFTRPTTQAAPTTPPPKVGVWSPWRQRGECSRHCDGGIQVFVRECRERGTNIKVDTCKGSWLKREFCNKRRCRELNTFLKQQCLETGKAKGMNNVTWFPGYLAATRCRLVCKSSHNNTVDQPAVDGTPCSYRYNDRCISGQCETYGCDYEARSSARFDKCGVCRGNGQTCRQIQTSFTSKADHPLNITTLRLPRGARSIYIKEHFSQASSHLLITTMSGVPVLDGAWMRGRPHTTLRVFMAGTEFFYRQVKGKPESLSSAVAPINEDLLVQVVRSERSPQGLRFRYYLNPNNPVDSYLWRMASTPCSVTCGKGYYVQHPVCLEKANMRTVDAYHCIPSKYHVNSTMSCSRSPCRRVTTSRTVSPTTVPTSWKVSNWTECPVTCGGGSRSRRVLCRLNHRTVPEARCDAALRPEQDKPCNAKPCPGVPTQPPVVTTQAPETPRPQTARPQTPPPTTLPPTTQSPATTAPAPVDGGFSAFSSWTRCTKTCDGGLQYRRRTCTNPSPAYDGRNCKGHRREGRLCHLQKCPRHQPDIRVGTCTAWNNGSSMWTPHTSSLQSCTLVCRQMHLADPVASKQLLADGTRCHSDQNDRCIGGKCRAVGCDNVLGSKAANDKCGVCRGDGQTCQDISGSYSVGHSLPSLYTAATLSRGARSTTIIKAHQERNNLILRAASDDKVLYDSSVLPFSFRGTVHIPFSNVYIKVRVTHTKEVMTIVGELSDDVKILLNVTQYAERPPSPGLLWRFSLDSRRFRPPRVSLAEQFERVFMVSGCSVTCGNGTVTVQERCLRRRDSRAASSGYCRTLSMVSAPATIPCQRNACPSAGTIAPERYEWAAMAWNACSKTCGRGLQSRSIECRRARDRRAVSHSLCTSRSRPPGRVRECNVDSCPLPPQWMIGAWRPCSVSCGGGQQQRDIVCKTYAPNQHCTEPRPMVGQVCGAAACPVNAAEPACVDKLSAYYCSLVRNFNLCRINRRYTLACCRTCSTPK